MAEALILFVIAAGIIYYAMQRGRKPEPPYMETTIITPDTSQTWRDGRYPFVQDAYFHLFRHAIEKKYPELLKDDERSIEAFTLLYALSLLHRQQQTEWINASIHDLELETVGLEYRAIRNARLLLLQLGALEERPVGNSKRLQYKLNSSIISS